MSFYSFAAESPSDVEDTKDSKGTKDWRSILLPWIAPTSLLLLGIALILHSLPSRTNAWDIKPIFLAIGVKNLNAVEAAIEKKPSAVRAIGLDGITPIFLASELGWKEGVDLLLAKGADPNAVNADGSMPLFAAIDANQHRVAIVRALLDAGASASARLPDGRNALHVAAASQRVELRVVALLARNAEAAHAKDNDGRTPEQVAEKHGLLAIANVLDQVR
jgi:ankyrin repeat protein